MVSLQYSGILLLRALKLLQWRLYQSPLEMPSDSLLIFDTDINPRWSDQDRLGHVNNAEYFRYFEEARIRWLDSLADSLDRSKEGPVVATTSCTYLHSVVYPCPLNCQLYLSKLGNSSFSLQQELTEIATGKLMVEGSVTLVWVNRETGKPTPIPNVLRNLLPPA